MYLVENKTDVIIDETIDRIQTHAGFLRLYKEKNEILGDIPIYQIGSVLIHGSKIDIPASLIKLCAKEKIPIHILTDLNKHYGSLNFTIDKGIINRQNQYRAILNDTWRLYLAKQILHQKLSIQLKMVRFWGNENYIGYLEKYISRIQEKTSFNSLLGVEGQAATLYWEIFGKEVIKCGYQWSGRQKHPTTDPVNSMLSLAYGLLATQCQSQLILQGLDPYSGILHITNEDRPALTYDIMEVYRSLIVDLWILGLLQSDEFRTEDFTKTKEGICTLVSPRKNDFFKLWFKRFKNFEFSTNYSNITLRRFMSSNTLLLVNWFEKIAQQKQRNISRFDRLPENLIVFKNIKEFMCY